MNAKTYLTVASVIAVLFGLGHKLIKRIPFLGEA